jgi:Ca2+/Na+ antiporter
MLQNVDLQLGFALGLFALFGIIRYRTNPIPIKEMTYLFLVICISVVNALSDKEISYIELLFVNMALIVITLVIEYFWSYKHESSKTIIYEKIELIKPQNQKKFIEDLEKRTGLKISRVEIGKINFLRDTAEVTIYYLWDKNSTNFFEGETLDNFTFKEKDDDE